MKQIEYIVWQLPDILKVVAEFILEMCSGHGISESCLCPLLEGQMIGFSSAIALDPVMCLQARQIVLVFPVGNAQTVFP